MTERGTASLRSGTALAQLKQETCYVPGVADAISGQSTGAVQRNLVPNCAPVMEYVAIPEGSSSAAPVMTPGPSAAAIRRSVETLRGAFEGADISLRVVSALGYANSGFPAAVFDRIGSCAFAYAKVIRKMRS